MYSLITYGVASKTLDFVVEGIEEYNGVNIISSHSEEIRSMIVAKMGRGVTIYQGRRGYRPRSESKNVDIVFTVVTRLELNKLHTALEKIDPHAFVVVHPVSDIHGGVVKRRPFK